MTEIKHTPGPWVVVEKRDGERLYIESAEYSIAYVLSDGAPDETDKANASLIAAAPALLEYVASSASAGCATAASLIAALTTSQRGTE